MKKLGKMIGAGSEKACYEVERRPDLVALVSFGKEGRWRKDIKLELRWLDAFRKLGIPTLKGKYASVLLKDKKVPALLVKRYDFHSYSIKWEQLTQRHIKSLKRIAKAFDKAKMYTTDTQFLFSKNGKVVLADCQQPKMVLGKYNYSAEDARQLPARLKDHHESWTKVA